MSSFIYNSCFLDAFRGRIDFDNASFKTVLLSNSYEPDKAAHSRRSDLTGEISGQGYEQGGAPVDVRMAMNGELFTLILGAVEFPKATLSARFAAYVVDHGGDPEEDELVALVDFGGDVSSTNALWALNASTLKIQN